MFYMGFKVVVVRRFRCTQTRPPRIVLFSRSPALVAAHAPRFYALNTYCFNPIKFIAGQITPRVLVCPN